MSYPLSSRHVFVRSGTSQVFVRLPGGWSDDARFLDDAQHAAEGWVHVRPVVPAAPEVSADAATAGESRKSLLTDSPR